MNTSYAVTGNLAKGRHIVTACRLGGDATAHGQTDRIFHPKEVMTALER